MISIRWSTLTLSAAVAVCTLADAALAQDNAFGTQRNVEPPAQQATNPTTDLTNLSRDPSLDEAVPIISDPTQGVVNTTPTDATLAPAPEELPDDPSLAAEAQADPGPVPIDLALPTPNDFAGVTTTPGTRRAMATGEAPEEYIVQKGDTLYDICDQLIGEGSYWPKLWSANRDIRNPHFIYPGMTLTFFPGDLDLPPHLQIIAEQEIVPIDKGKIDESFLIKELLAQESAGYEPPFTEVIGPENIQISPEIESMIEVAGSIFDPRTITLRVPGFVFGDRPNVLATIESDEQGRTATVQGDRIWISTRETIYPNAVYTIVRPRDIITDTSSASKIGAYYEYIANIRVTEFYNDKGIAIGEITDTRLPTQQGDVVIAFRATRREIPSEAVSVGGSATQPVEIVHVGEGGHTAVGSGGIVFINRGTQAGIAPGQYFDIYTGRANKGKISDKFPFPVFAGVIRVIDVTDVAAAAYVVSSKRELRRGDGGRSGG